MTNELALLAGLNTAFGSVAIYLLRRWLEKIDSKLDDLSHQMNDHDKKVAILEQRLNSFEAHCKAQCVNV